MEIDPARFDMTVISCRVRRRSRRSMSSRSFGCTTTSGRGRRTSKSACTAIPRPVISSSWLATTSASMSRRQVRARKTSSHPSVRGHSQRWKEDILEQGGRQGRMDQRRSLHPVDPVTKVVADRGRFPSGARRRSRHARLQIQPAWRRIGPRGFGSRRPRDPTTRPSATAPGPEADLDRVSRSEHGAKRDASSSPTSRRTTPEGGTIRPRRRCCDWSRARAAREAEGEGSQLHPGARRRFLRAQQPTRAWTGSSPPKSGILKTCPAGSNAAGSRSRSLFRA